MAGDGRDLIGLLRDELRFIELGGYDSSKRGAWFPKELFRDSLTCINFGIETRSHPCEDCHLFHFVAFEQRTKDVPYHFIPLTDSGDTIAGLEKTTSFTRLKQQVKLWLRWKIGQLELEQCELNAPAQH